MNTEYDVWLGLDVGKISHHGCGLGSAGERVFDHELAQDETALRDVITRLHDEFGRVLVIVDQPNTIGALPVAVARDCGADIAYLPGLAMRKAADLYPGQAKTDARDAFIIADTARTMPHTLRSVDRESDVLANLKVLAGTDEDLAHDTTRAINRLRSLLLQIHPAGYDNVKWPRHDGFIWPHPGTTHWFNRTGATTLESRVELFATIRRDARIEGLSIRALAKRHNVHRRTIRQALDSAEPPPRKPVRRSSPKLAPYKPAIDAMLRSDLDAPRKQRHTATRILNRLIDEHAAAGLSYSTVRDYVRTRRAEIDAAAGRRKEVFIPQHHPPGAEAEVDFGEVWIILDGVRTKCHMFVYRLSHSGNATHRVYPTCGQEAFLEGHIDAFSALGGIPTRHIRYDNLTAAVTTVLHGKDRRRKENDRWVLFASHYGFDPFYCQPGLTGAHEKGGVEGEVGWFRRNHLTPMPNVTSLAELNEQIRRWEADDDRRRISGKLTTIGDDYAAERDLLAPLPVEAFDPGLVLHPRVDRSSMITVRMMKYSVPAHLIGRKVRVSLRASHLNIFDGHRLVATHPRVASRGGHVVDLDHYLEVLKHKPGALPGSTALAAARASGAFTPTHDAFWAETRKVNGDSEGTKELIDVLLLHRALPADAVIAGIRAALKIGAVSAEVVAIEARRHTPTGGATSDRHHAVRTHGHEQKVVSLTQRRLTDPDAVIAGLPPDTRPLPSVAA